MNSIWTSPSLALALRFFGGRAPEIDRALIETIMQAASGPDGLALSSRLANA